MKKIVLLILVITFLTIGTAEAGIFGSIGGFFKEQFLAVIVTGLFAVISGIFGKKYLKYKKPLLELADVYESIKKARSVTSNGGKKITQAEYGVIFKELEEAVVAVVEVLPMKWTAKIKK